MQPSKKYLSDNLFSNELKATRILLLILSAFFLSLFTCCKNDYIIDNPYKNVDWENFGRYKADFHIHTSRSDGHYSPDAIIDRYIKAGFSVLSLTDHNLVTYPWQKFSTFKPSDYVAKNWETDINYLPYEKIFVYKDLNPDSLGVIAVQGNEISYHHHIGSYFSDCNCNKNESGTIEEIAKKNGLAVINHPGRIEGDENKAVEWYVELFRRHKNLIGMEVYNTGLYHQPGSVNKWDSTLISLMPERPVWGFSNEDYHGDYRKNGDIRHLPGRNGNELLLPELSVDEVRKAMESGHFLFFHAPKGPGGPAPPLVNSIKINNHEGTIHINASGYKYIEWISKGKVITSGDKIKLSDLPLIDKYVRAVIYESPNGAFICTQPFGIIRR